MSSKLVTTQAPENDTSAVVCLVSAPAPDHEPELAERQAVRREPDDLGLDRACPP